MKPSKIIINGVSLDQIRVQPIELRIDRRKASSWRILTLQTRENRGREPLVVFRLERA